MKIILSGQKKKPRLTYLHRTGKFQNKLLKVFIGRSELSLLTYQKLLSSIFFLIFTEIFRRWNFWFETKLLIYEITIYEITINYDKNFKFRLQILKQSHCFEIGNLCLKTLFFDSFVGSVV